MFIYSSLKQLIIIIAGHKAFLAFGRGLAYLVEHIPALRKSNLICKSPVNISEMYVDSLKPRLAISGREQKYAQPQLCYKSKAHQNQLITMKLNILLACLFSAVSAASTSLRGTEQQVEAEKRKLTEEVRNAVWLLGVTLEDGAVFKADETVCNLDGETVLFHTFVARVATDTAHSFLQTYAQNNAIPENDVVWELPDWSRRVMEDDQEHRGLVEGFIWLFGSNCNFCNPDNPDSRRLGSSNGSIVTLSDNVASALYELTKTLCGVTYLTEVTFDLIDLD
jgi:hypothetical protein